MNEKKPVHFLLLLAASFFVVVSCEVVLDTVTSTDHWKGFIYGSSLPAWNLSATTWLIFVLPLNLFVLALYQWRKWRRGRTLLILAPSLFCYIGVALLFAHTETGVKGFESVMGQPVPPSAQGFLSYYGRTGNNEDREVYYFQCAPLETETLIKALEAKFPGLSNPSDTNIPSAGWPDLATWAGKKTYSRSDSNTFRVCTLITDEKEEKVYLFVEDH